MVAPPVRAVVEGAPRIPFRPTDVMLVRLPSPPWRDSVFVFYVCSTATNYRSDAALMIMQKRLSALAEPALPTTSYVT
jgi:hypothetical protein